MELLVVFLAPLILAGVLVFRLSQKTFYIAYTVAILAFLALYALSALWGMSSASLAFGFTLFFFMYFPALALLRAGMDVLKAPQTQQFPTLPVAVFAGSFVAYQTLIVAQHVAAKSDDSAHVFLFVTALVALVVWLVKFRSLAMGLFAGIVIGTCGLMLALSLHVNSIATDGLRRFARSADAFCVQIGGRELRSAGQLSPFTLVAGDILVSPYGGFFTGHHFFDNHAVILEKKDDGRSLLYHWSFRKQAFAPKALVTEASTGQRHVMYELPDNYTRSLTCTPRKDFLDSVSWD